MTMLDMGVASLASILAGSITDLISISYGMFFCGFMCVLIGAITFTVHRKLIKI